MSKISPETLKSRPWHAFQDEKSSSRWDGGRILEVLLPVVVIAVLLFFKAHVMAAVVAGLTAVFWLVKLSSPTGRHWLDKAMRVLSHWVGQIVATVLLAPVFFLVMTCVRLMGRLTGSDPLMLRSAEAPTFWVPSDVESRRARYVKSMFCTERLVGARVSLLPILVLGGALIAAAELGLRLYGFGTPLLYVQDQEIGWYPKPKQQARLPGRTIVINNVGMRSEDVAPKKPPGHVRILLLGDSTLAGTWVSNHELYSALLEEKLNAAAGASIFEVLNMGVNGWGPFHELGYVKKFGTFEADVAMICGPVGDCRRPLVGLEREPFPPETHPPRWALEQMFYQFCWRYREGCLGPQPWQVGEGANRQMRLGIAAYADLSRYLRQQGAEVWIEMLPSKADMLGGGTDTSAHEWFAELARQVEGVTISANCGSAVFRDAQPAAKIYHDAAHFDRLGHRLYADYLFQRLRTGSPRLQQFFPHR